jgi:hypothetical protein
MLHVVRLNKCHCDFECHVNTKLCILMLAYIYTLQQL